MDRLAQQYGEAVIFLCINTRSIQDAKQYKAQKNLTSPALIHGAASPPGDYGLKYIPHKVLIDKNGKIVKNFDGINLKSDVRALM
mmetsp:Transcript_56703/g.111681  ORF Transcript_56703/g.111681 Transcript_56703/m.111681 type:complete len:85 (+) Transcript_56703:176-430(+)